jgi:nucleoside-diphosphate-sugar epimerase
VLHALARAGADRGPLEGLPIRWHAGDLVDGAGVDRALAAAREQAGSAGLDVIHSGALISYATRDRELQERINITGTQHMLRAPARAARGPALRKGGTTRRPESLWLR